MEDGFAVTVYRDGGRWDCALLPPAVLDDLDACVAALRQQPPEGGAVALVDVADEFFVALRLTPSGDLRVLLSDMTAAEEWDIARQALDLVYRHRGSCPSRPTRKRCGRSVTWASSATWAWTSGSSARYSGTWTCGRTRCSSAVAARIGDRRAVRAGPRAACRRVPSTDPAPTSVTARTRQPGGRRVVLRRRASPHAGRLDRPRARPRRRGRRGRGGRPRPRRGRRTPTTALLFVEEDDEYLAILRHRRRATTCGSSSPTRHAADEVPGGRDLRGAVDREPGGAGRTTSDEPARPRTPSRSATPTCWPTSASPRRELIPLLQPRARCRPT